jgi:hypothetical protein
VVSAVKRIVAAGRRAAVATFPLRESDGFKIDRRHRGVAGRKINLMALSLEHLRLTVQAENALSSCLIAWFTGFECSLIVIIL